MPEALAATTKVCASVNVATSRAGINMDAVSRMARILEGMAEAAERGALAIEKLEAMTVICSVVFWDAHRSCR